MPSCWWRKLQDEHAQEQLMGDQWVATAMLHGGEFHEGDAGTWWTVRAPAWIKPEVGVTAHNRYQAARAYCNHFNLMEAPDAAA